MKIKYRNIKKYKYQLLESYSIETEINQYPAKLGDEYVSLEPDGTLHIGKHYAWDGASGALDTKTFMRASLVHDALYQLMRNNWIPYKVHRKDADQIMRQICIEDGMARFRAWYVYRVVRMFGTKSARP